MNTNGNDRIAALMDQLAREIRGSAETSKDALPSLRDPEAQCVSNAQPREKENNKMIASPTEPPVLMTRAEVAELIRIDLRTLDRWRADPEVRFPVPVRVGRVLRWRRSSVERWLGRHGS